MSQHQRRPRRARRADRLTSDEAADRNAVQCDFVIAPFDRMATEADRRWGVDVLPSLVSTQTAQRYGSALAKLNAALDVRDPDECRHRAEVCMRGITAMEAEAVAAGHEPADPRVWLADVDGLKVCIIADRELWPLAQKKYPGHHIYTMQEAVLGIRKIRNQLVDAVKQEFPGSEVTAQNERFEPPAEMPDDEIPF